MDSDHTGTSATEIYSTHLVLYAALQAYLPGHSAFVTSPLPT